MAAESALAPPASPAASELAEEVRRTSLAILRGRFPVEVIDAWREAFAPLLERGMALEGDDPNRGPGRYYVTLPFEGLFADPAILADPLILDVVDRLVGPDPVLCQLATDTPVRGSEHQDLHRDAPPLFPESGRETPPFQLAVNFPLVDVTEANGPMEWAPGTHLMPRVEALERVRSGEIPLERAYMNRGDVMIRDVRHIHRGTPNPSAEPRPMVVIGYSRRWLFRPEVGVDLKPEVRAGLPERLRHLLRFAGHGANRSEGEVYRAFAY